MPAALPAWRLCRHQSCGLFAAAQKEARRRAGGGGVAARLLAAAHRRRRKAHRLAKYGGVCGERTAAAGGVRLWLSKRVGAKKAAAAAATAAGTAWQNQPPVLLSAIVGSAET